MEKLFYHRFLHECKHKVPKSALISVQRIYLYISYWGKRTSSATALIYRYIYVKRGSFKVM